jgi:hypothetical protein
MDYDQALDEVISAAVWWYCTDTNQRRLRNALDIVISRVDEAQADRPAASSATSPRSRCGPPPKPTPAMM